MSSNSFFSECFLDITATKIIRSNDTTTILNGRILDDNNAERTYLGRQQRDVNIVQIVEGGICKGNNTTTPANILLPKNKSSGHDTVDSVDSTLDSDGYIEMIKTKQMTTMTKNMLSGHGPSKANK